MAAALTLSQAAGRAGGLLALHRSAARHNGSRQGGVRLVAASAAAPRPGPPPPDHHADEASTSGRGDAWQPGVAALAAAAALLPASAAHASGLGGESVDPGLLQLVLTSIEAAGPWGPAAFVALVALAECIPLFPTQPFSLASGLLFGTQKGALCMLSGTTLAALLAFSIARGVGRPLAERVIGHELSGSDDEAAAAGGEPGPVQRKLAEAQAAIERGSFWQQAGAVLLLRMTPVVPFSASNYVLGLSPLPLPPYLAGTVAGMAFWSLFYASLGGASRSLLARGGGAEAALAELAARAGEYTRELGLGGALAGGAALAWLGAGALRQRLAAADGPEPRADPEGRADGDGGGGSGGLSSSLARGSAAAARQLGGGRERPSELVARGVGELLRARGGKQLAESRAKE